ncbi:MAG TPA: dipeptide/oligopeptide/nickel ABC transporter permease/ATP-binding protein [Acidimicrobiales bacterium]|nr:dipeptide/oligopeptide/nickel ABC transporter permease/ATP-binding protein [Acidimicrobiales bacterium]
MTLADTDPARLADAAPHGPAGAPVPDRARRHGRRTGGTGRSLGAVGAVLLGICVAAAVFAPVLASHSPRAVSGEPFARPSPGHPLGTNDVGQDLFAQLVHGARLSLVIALGAALLAVVVGTAVAVVAGYYRGPAEVVLMRLVDLMLGFPFLVLVIVLAAFFGRGLGTTIAVIGAVLWARPARILRSQVIKLREQAHVVAARSMGARGPRVIARHIVPRIAPLTAAQFVRAANVAVMLEASLSFLGLGDPNRVSWGTMLYFANARSAFLTDAWKWWVLPPGLALTTVILGLAFIGTAVEEWADPRLRRSAARPVRRSAGVKRLPAVPGAPALEVTGLEIEYRLGRSSVRAVDGVDLEVGRGRLLGLVGESGSGKTTIALAVSGVLRPPGRVLAGDMRLGGRPVGRPARPALAPYRGRDVALVPQAAQNALNPAWPVLRQVVEAARLTRPEGEAVARSRELLERVGLDRSRHDAYPHELSGGMRQRALIAMALVNEPDLLVADEPASGLDVVTRAQVLKLLLELRDELDVGILMVSHDLPTVARVADDLAVMYQGKIVERGPAGEVSRSPQHPYTRSLFDAFPDLTGERKPLAPAEQ